MFNFCCVYREYFVICEATVVCLEMMILHKSMDWEGCWGYKVWVWGFKGEEWMPEGHGI